jgi:hypothetical protein
MIGGLCAYGASTAFVSADRLLVFGATVFHFPTYRNDEHGDER